MIELELKPVPSDEWQLKFDRVMSDEYVSKKYDRKRRLEDKAKFIGLWCEEVTTPEIFDRPRVLDIGPGPGEFLELAKHFGNEVIGIDAETGAGGMGEEYLELSRLMTGRQEIMVHYCGVQNFQFGSGTEIEMNSLSFICLQGSFEQCFSQYMIGTPHDVHHDCKKLRWPETEEMIAEFQFVLDMFRDLLQKNGSLVIWGNGASNSRWWIDAMHRASKNIGWTPVAQKNTLFKWINKSIKDARK